jgi:hypothetical protein
MTSTLTNKAFQELAKGEQTASALEAHLDALEGKIDELLAKAEQEHKSIMANSRAAEKPEQPANISSDS